MAIILACCNERANHQGQVFSIAVGNLPYPRLEQNGVELFAPSWEIVKAHKAEMAKLNAQLARNEITLEGYHLQARYADRQYKVGYAEVLRPRHAAIKSWLESLDPNIDMTLVSFCSHFWNVAGVQRRRFCHRLLVGDIIQNHRKDISIVTH